MEPEADGSHPAAPVTMAFFPESRAMLLCCCCLLFAVFCRGRDGRCSQGSKGETEGGARVTGECLLVVTKKLSGTREKVEDEDEAS